MRGAREGGPLQFEADEIDCHGVEPEVGAPADDGIHSVAGGKKTLPPEGRDQTGRHTVLPPPAADAQDPQRGMELTLGMTQNSQPSNYFNLSSVTLPIEGETGSLPVGLQLMCPAGEDRRVLSIALAVEGVIGPGKAPPLDAFLEA